MTAQKQEWERISESETINTDRLEVPGGWLYRDSVYFNRKLRVNLVFVPTAARSWGW